MALLVHRLQPHLLSMALETSNNHHYLVTLGGQCLQDGLELMVPLKHNKNILCWCSKRLIIRGFVLTPLEEVKRNSSRKEVWSDSHVLSGLEIKWRLDRELVNIEPTSTWISDGQQVINTMGKSSVSIVAISWSQVSFRFYFAPLHS